MYAQDLDRELFVLSEDVRCGRYVPGPFHRFEVHDPKTRMISAPLFRDRVLHHAIMNVCEPVFERWLIDDTFACRRNKGRDTAVRRAGTFAFRYAYFLKCDIRKYFDSVSHVLLRDRLIRLFKDPQLIDLFDRILASHESSSCRGLPIGSLTSQHLANAYLGSLDRFVKEKMRIGGYVRYMDDFVLWADDRKLLRTARDRIRNMLIRELDLEMKPSPFLNRTAHGMDFLGARIFPSHSIPSRQSRQRFSRKMDELEKGWLEGEIDERELQVRSTSALAFLRSAKSHSWRWRHNLLRSLEETGQGHEPRAPRRQLEQQRQELPYGEPQ